MHARAYVIAPLVLAMTLGMMPAAAGQSIDSTVPTMPEAMAKHAEAAPAPLVVWNRTITVFRQSYGRLTPAQRAENAVERVSELPKVADDWQLTTVEVASGDEHGIIIASGGKWLFAILQGDVDRESGQTMETAAHEAVANLDEMLHARAGQYRLPALLRSIGEAVAATAIFLAVVWLLLRLRRVALRAADQVVGRRLHRRDVYGVDVRQLMLRILTLVGHALTLVAVAMLAYLWLSYALTAFPYTQPWGLHLQEALWGHFLRLLSRIAVVAENLLIVAVIFLITRSVTRVVGGALKRVEKGEFATNWLDSETARVTRLLVTIALWIFALTIAYPYIPGSESPAFKGISVLIGLMVSLGSSGLVNQLMSGLAVIYSRTLKPGDYVHVGNDEGKVREVGFLATKIVTPRREEITIPNAVLIANATTNYSRLAAEHGCIVPTSVTIGYDAPWRQVHALLLLAAERTSVVRREPRPYVLQAGLGDFYVEYRLHVYIDHAEDRISALSELHTRIQDAFNEFGVQIMSPHFVLQPREPVVVPKDKWSAPPAAEPREEEGNAAG